MKNRGIDKLSPNIIVFCFLIGRAKKTAQLLQQNRFSHQYKSIANS